MRERQPLEGRRPWRERRDAVVERHGLGWRGRHVAARAEIVDERGPCATLGSSRGTPSTLSATSICLAVVPIAVAGDEEHRLDLAEAVEHALRRRNRASRTTRPRRSRRRPAWRRWSPACSAASRRRGRPSPMPSARKRLLQARDQRAQFVPGQPALDLVLAAKDDGVAGRRAGAAGSRRSSAWHRGRTRARHAVAVGEHASAAFADHAAEIPDQAPEAGAVLDRPAMQVGVGREIPAGACDAARGEGGQRRVLDRGQTTETRANHCRSCALPCATRPLISRRGCRRYWGKIASTRQKTPLTGHIGLK